METEAASDGSDMLIHHMFTVTFSVFIYQLFISWSLTLLLLTDRK